MIFGNYILCLWKKKRKSELAVRALYPRPEGRGFTAQVITRLISPQIDFILKPKPRHHLMRKLIYGRYKSK